MNSRIYLDYNATAPLANSVMDFLKSDDLPFGNPSSTHSTGKFAKGFITKSQKIIRDIFQTPDAVKLFFHSGATEGINTFFNINKDCVMAYFSSDHSVVSACAKKHQESGGKVLELPICSNGQFDLEVIKTILTPYKENDIYLNYTYANNETGIIWTLEEAKVLKHNFPKMKVHVDGAQIIGKHHDWHLLDFDLDAYTFSGHKFGALKGTGFTFLKNELMINPLIKGGGQQSNLRSGTENAIGIYSIALALKETLDNFDHSKMLEIRKQFEGEIIEILKDNISIIGQDSPRLANTISLYHRSLRGDLAQIKFDLNGIDISFGSACSSGSSNGSHVLNAMGLQQFNRNLIRISFGATNFVSLDFQKIRKTLKEL